MSTHIMFFSWRNKKIKYQYVLVEKAAYLEMKCQKCEKSGMTVSPSL